MSQPFVDIFKQELYQLQHLMEEFAEKHPELRPMVSGWRTDPSVDRLKQCMAFQTAMLRRKLDDDFPEITQGIIGRVSYYLRPIPAISTVAFTQDQPLASPALIPKWTPLNSKPVGGAACRFATCYDVEMHPLTLIDAGFDRFAGQFPRIRLTMELSGIDLSRWNVEKLRFFIAGEYAEAADIYFLLMRHLKQIVIRPLDGGPPCILPGSDLKDAGFSDESAVIPCHPNDSPVFRLLQEYFILPEKFLYVDLCGWKQWRSRGSGSQFEICFEFDSLPVKEPRVAKDTLVLCATPVINLFEASTNPIEFDSQNPWALLRPGKGSSAHDQVFSVESVTGSTKGSVESIVYLPFEEFVPDSKSSARYNLSYRTPLLGGDPDVFLSVDSSAARNGTDLPHTITASLKCTNGRLPKSLGVGDICEYLPESPQFATFTNIKPVTPGFFRPMDKNALWHELSHRQFNRYLLNDRKLHSVLKFYTFPQCRDYQAAAADARRIDGIQSIRAKRAIYLFQGAVMRGSEVEMSISRDNFSSHGDMYLFGCVLDYFLGAFATENSFTQLIMKEEKTGQVYEWPAREGYRHLF